jgi:hypothetical protein
LALGALAPAAALGSFPGGNGVIAYTAEHSIWAVDPATGDQLRLTSGPDDSWPAFSPSGNMLAFQRWAASTITVYISRADGSEARPLVQGSEPAFSPNGRQIVFVRNGGLFLTGLMPGSPVRQITRQPGDREPNWSSKGSIVFERTDIWHALVTCLPSGLEPGAEERLFKRGERRCAKPHVSHERRMERQRELDLITPPSLRVRQVLVVPSGEAPVADLSPEWSPDGTTIAISACGWEPPDERRNEELPRLHYIQSCGGPFVWAPQGGQLTSWSQLGISGLISCPVQADPSSVISWQPLTSGTLRVPTAACAATPHIPAERGEFEPEPEHEPVAIRVPPTVKCSRHHHKLHC